MRTAGAACGTARRAPAAARGGQQLAPRRAPQAVVQRQLKAADADDRVRGHAFGFQLLCARGRESGPTVAQRSGWRPRPSGELRAGRLRWRRLRPAPRRRVPAASRAAAASSCGSSTSPARSPGNTSERRPHDPAAFAAACRRSSARTRAQRPEQARVHAHRHRHQSAGGARGACPLPCRLRGGRRSQRAAGSRRPAPAG